MKKIIIFIVTAFTLVILASCANYDDVQEELLSYYNDEWLPISVFNKSETNEPLKKIIRILSERGEEDEEVFKIREEEIIPITEGVLKRFKSITLEHEKVKELNELQIEIAELDRDGDISSNDYIKGDITRSELWETWNELREKREAIIIMI